MKPDLAVDPRPNWLFDGRLDGLRQHWHQPLLPHDCEQVAVGAAIAALPGRLAATARRLAAILALWVQRSRSRRKLAALSDYTLRDVGLTRADVWQETSKPFWRD